MANLDREAMRAAAARIQRLSDEHWSTLAPSCRLMEDGAWVGPAGDRFGVEVRAAQRELQDLLTAAARSAREKLAALPDTA
ncbi:hypothetical protein [Microtetraspora fusca]|uniref:hypothetical protein n=1 Tax=Microtetraspora fusca TaxID=1997 RepID=UPI00082A2046|nr:hypothetical protein [Microtetraspora fusca]